MWIEQLKNGKYKYFERYKDRHGRTKRVSITLDKNTKQAQNQASKLLLEKIQKKQNAKDRLNVKFWDIADEFEHFSEKIAKDTTRTGYHSARKRMERHLDKDILLEQVTKQVIKELLETLYYTENYAESTISIQKAYISNIFKYAIDQGYDIENNSRGIKIAPKTKTIEDIENAQPKYLETDELKEVLALAETKNHRFKLMTEFLALTGLRFGECVGLQHKNWHDNSIDIVGTLNPANKIKGTPKNEGSYRKVSLNKRANDILKEITEENKKHGYPQQTNDYIWISLRNGKPVSNYVYNRFLKSVSVNPDMTLTAHILRHTHISILTELKVPLKAIMDRVGHVNPETTLKIYTHVTQKLGEEVIDKLNKLDL